MVVAAPTTSTNNSSPEAHIKSQDVKEVFVPERAEDNEGRSDAEDTSVNDAIAVPKLADITLKMIDPERVAIMLILSKVTEVIPSGILTGPMRAKSATTPPPSSPN